MKWIDSDGFPSLLSAGCWTECSDMIANLSLWAVACSFLRGFDAQKRTVMDSECCTPVKPQYMTPVDEVVRYRLRREGRIVGWMREEQTGQRFYSREGLWWSGRKIKWTHRDRCCGLKDADDRWLHEGDLVKDLKSPWWSRHHQWLILCDERTGWSLVRNGWGGRMLSLSEEDICKKPWRWSGFAWLSI